jgi:hypothetical protein
MHVYKIKVCIKTIGTEYDQRPIAFLKALLLLKGVFKALVLRILELRTVYRTTQVQTSKKVQQIRNSTPNNINRTKQDYRATTHVARIA